LIGRLTRWRKAAWRIAKWPIAIGVVILLLLLMPVGYVELACRGDAAEQTYRPLINDAAFQRSEANTYLTYPEWHIVYAYDGLAEALKSGDEHAFDYIASVNGFWRSTCALMRVADAHGGADSDTRTMIHTIGVSFTAEMAVKAAYEETIGRATAWIRGREKTPQDKEIAAMAIDYAAFLRQTPWYQYPFRREIGELWSTPTSGFVRGWERRFGIGLEFATKAAYARVIGGAVAATAPAKLTIRSVVSGIEAPDLASIPEVIVIGPRGQGLEIETPRYDLFTRILVEIAKRGGTIQEIAGNDDIMITLTTPEGADLRLQRGTVLHRMRRDGFRSDRLLVGLKVPDLAALLRDHPLADPGLEHIFDY
jgi:hypothetical protein